MTATAANDDQHWPLRKIAAGLRVVYGLPPQPAQPDTAQGETS